jgi:hypothetical protein
MDDYERNTYVAALIGTARSLESAATRLEHHGDHLTARSMRRDAELAEAALEGPDAFVRLCRNMQHLV